MKGMGKRALVFVIGMALFSVSFGGVSGGTRAAAEQAAGPSGPCVKMANGTTWCPVETAWQALANVLDQVPPVPDPPPIPSDICVGLLVGEWCLIEDGLDELPDPIELVPEPGPLPSPPPNTGCIYLLLDYWCPAEDVVDAAEDVVTSEPETDALVDGVYKCADSPTHTCAEMFRRLAERQIPEEAELPFLEQYYETVTGIVTGLENTYGVNGGKIVKRMLSEGYDSEVKNGGAAVLATETESVREYSWYYNRQGPISECNRSSCWKTGEYSVTAHTPLNGRATSTDKPGGHRMEWWMNDDEPADPFFHIQCDDRGSWGHCGERSISAWNERFDWEVYFSHDPRGDSPQRGYYFKDPEVYVLNDQWGWQYQEHGPVLSPPRKESAPIECPRKVGDGQNPESACFYPGG